MSVTCYPSPGKQKAMKICNAFAKGCGGLVAAAGQNRLQGGPAFFYGWTAHTEPLIAQCKAEGRVWYYADNAYAFGRKVYYRVTKGALMLNGHPMVARNRSRFAAFRIDIKPWRESGKHILIATQSELHYQIHLGIGREAWVAEVVSQLKRLTNRKIVVCRKPPSNRNSGNMMTEFDQRVVGAHAVVSHSSGCLVWALIAGVPVISLGNSMVGDLAGSGLGCIENPPRLKGRRALMETLAANQWTKSEMSRGTAWRALQGMM